MTWTQGGAAVEAGGPAESEQESLGDPISPEGKESWSDSRRPGALGEPERQSQERQEQQPGPQLNPVMAKEPQR